MVRPFVHLWLKTEVGTGRRDVGFATDTGSGSHISTIGAIAWLYPVSTGWTELLN
jgi:hypothetical protein